MVLADLLTNTISITIAYQGVGGWPLHMGGDIICPPPTAN